MKYLLSNKADKGFTLVELVIVIVLLGILSVGISGFLKLGSQIFVDVKNRSEIVATARFAIERLNRELRTALPNSVRVTLTDQSGNSTNIQCIEYIPILTTANYLDIPTESENETAKTLSVVDFNTGALNGLVDYRVAVYPASINEVYQNIRIRTLENATIDNTTHVAPPVNNRWDINFTNDVSFPSDSPTGRLYFIGTKVSYCVQGDELKRFTGDSPNDQNSLSSAVIAFRDNGVLMAEDLSYTPANFSGNDFPFKLSQATQFRNATALIKLRFNKNEEVVVFNSEVHVPNAP
ncbi:PilW family protein [Pseudocolwellia agarivorans]|uniref:PilW family protein n=1 Tax=Pseudocolwellia agarivorans TaxID=1911682 RepID=UPI000985FB1C|nr:type II secretion system protein [Pseudocolwellia agarivorans]